MKQFRKKSLAVTLVFLLLVVTVAFCVPFPCGEAEAQDLEFTIRTSVTYSNNGTGVWNFTEGDRAISLFMNNSWQTVNLTEHSFSIENVTNDDDGNPLAVLQFDKEELKPGENISYAVTYRIVSKPRPLPNIAEEKSENLSQIPKNLSDKYCGPEGPWQINDTELRELAQNIAGSETRVLTIVKGFIKWIKENIKYPNLSHEVPFYPNKTYAKREGDCDEQAILLITLCRIYGVPAFLQIGCIYMPTQAQNETYWNGHETFIQKRIGWHGWAMVYIPPWGWLSVDLTYVWGGLGGEYLNAIRKAAVTSRYVIQYMNVTKTDYINLTSQARDFLQVNDFYVYVEDEMTQETSQRTFWQEQLPWILIATGTAVTIIGVAIYIRTSKGKATTPPSTSPYSSSYKNPSHEPSHYFHFFHL